MECSCSRLSPPYHPNNNSFDILSSGHRIGPSIQRLETLYQTVSTGTFSSCKIVQFYMSNLVFTQADKQKTLKYCNNTDSTFYIHCPNNTNFGRSPDHYIARNSVKIVKNHLSHIQELPCACVLHIGSVGSIQNVASNLNDVQIRNGTHPRMGKQLLLENSAGQGTQLGKSYEELRLLYEALDRTNVGVCLDTQHAFASGLSDLESHESVVKLFEELHPFYGKYPDLIHLNDSTTAHRSRKDRHHKIGTGQIWSRSDESLKAILNFSHEYQIDLVSETEDPIGDIKMLENSYLKYETCEY